MEELLLATEAPWAIRFSTGFWTLSSGTKTSATLAARDAVSVDKALQEAGLGMPTCRRLHPELHRGFLESYEALQPGVAAALSVLGAADSPFVWVTGHSLGAAMAEVATFELIAQGFPVSTAYTFGTPRVGNPAWASAYAAVMNQKGVANFRVIHDKDAVPHLPPKVSNVADVTRVSEAAVGHKARYPCPTVGSAVAPWKL